jgi:histidine triad (HIT) family protein/ATP adenylyltransferase
LPGRTIVAPRAHVEHLFRDLDRAAYLRLQDVVYRVARAVEQAVASERTYALSLGSQQGNSHVHWMVAPLPPGTPYERQQYHALMAENGTIAMSTADASALAGRIREHL